MKFPSVKILAESAANTVKRFPLEVMFALAGTIAANIVATRDVYDAAQETWCYRVMMMANLGLLLSLSATLFAQSRGFNSKKSWLLRGLAALFAISLLFILNPGEREFDYLRFLLFSLGFHLLVSFAAFTRGEHIHGFWQFNKTLFLRFLGGALYSGVLYLGLIAAISATRFLFNLTLDNDIYATLFVWIAGMFNTLFFLAGMLRDIQALDEDQSYPKGLKLFTQYVLIPLATVYVLILLSYEVKIAAEWSLPKGLVSNLILGYAVFGILSILLVYPIRNHEENKWIKTYARSFYILMIPLLVLLFLAVLARVLPYGITEQRYFLLALAGWLTFITVYFLVSRKQNIKVIPISLCIVSLLAIYGPLSAFTVSRYSQRKILTNIFERYGRFKDGKLLPLGNVKMSKKDGIEAYEKIEYLADGDKMRALQGYVMPDIVAVSDSLAKGIKKERYMYRYELKGKQVEWMNKYLGLNKFATDEYTLPKNYVFMAESGSLLDVKEYDYVARTGELYDFSEPDTMRLKNEGVMMVRDKNKDDVYSLTINNEKVQVSLKDIAYGLLKKEYQLKKYTKPGGKNTDKYVLPAEMLSVTRQTANYIVIFRIEKLEFDRTDGKVGNMYNLSGYYLIKKK